MRDEIVTLRSLANLTAAGLATHEAVCGERYKTLLQHMKLVTYSVFLLALAEMFGAQHLVQAAMKSMGIG